MLETTETLEQILFFLPVMDVFTCRRLSSRVKDVINGSLALREKMFLHSTRAAREAWRLDPEIDGSGKGITSVRRVVGMIPFNGNLAGHQQWSPATPHVIRTPAILNPIILNRTDRIPDLYESRDDCDYFFASDIVHRIETGGPNRQDGILDMYLTQPPCRQAWVRASFSIPQGPSNPSEVSYLDCSALLELGRGITIRDLSWTTPTVRGFVSVYRWAPKPPRKKKKRWSYTNWEPRKYKKREPRGHLPAEIFYNATLFEVLQSLDIEGVPSANEVQADMVGCWLLDTIVATDEMRAGVAPYTEDATQ